MHHGPNAFHPLCLAVFIIGQILHAWMKASQVIQAQTNGLKTYREYFALRAPQIATRFFGCYLIFAGWQFGLLADLADFVPGAEPFMQAHPHPIPVNVLTAGAFGYLGDFGLNRILLLLAKKIPGIQAELPPPDPAPAGEAKP